MWCFSLSLRHIAMYLQMTSLSGTSFRSTLLLLLEKFSFLSRDFHLPTHRSCIMILCCKIQVWPSLFWLYLRQTKGDLWSGLFLCASSYFVNDQGNSETYGITIKWLNFKAADLQGLGFRGLLVFPVWHRTVWSAQ